MIQKPRQWPAAGDSRPRRPVDQMDVWLESQGLYRKHTARDETCLFRAVAEQLFFTQVYHADVRRATVEYILRNPQVFQPMVDEPIDIYAERMRSLKEYGGDVEIAVMSIMYKHDFLMYCEIGQPAKLHTNNGFESKITLCVSLDRHYDSVFTKEYINDAALCQSLVYDLLYKNVFELKEVDYAVSKMLHDKNNKHQHRDTNVPLIDCFSLRYEMRDSYTNVKELLEMGITPFPYKVAKALEAEVYRNVEYDTWADYRKGLRYGFCSWACRDLQVGVKCSVKIDENTTHIGHIQEMAPNRGPVVVYIDKIGVMMTVPYKSLAMIPPPPVVLSPARPSSTINQKYASLLSSMANKKEDQAVKLRRPTKHSFVQNNKPKDEAFCNKTAKPQDARRDKNQDSKLRSDFGRGEDNGHQQATFPRRVNVGEMNRSGGEQQQEAISQIYMPIEGSRNHVYIVNAQPIVTNHITPAPIPEPQPPNYVPMTVVPLQVNIMAPKSVILDGSDLPHSDVSTLRYCYNLGVDCMRMNYSTWALNNTRPVGNVAPIISQPQTYLRIENDRSITESNTIASGHPVEEQMVQQGEPIPTNPTEESTQYHCDESSEAAINCNSNEGEVAPYEEHMPIQHPEVSSTTPSTCTAPCAYYNYPLEYNQPVCHMSNPYLEYVEYFYDMRTPQTVFPSYPVTYVSPDGTLYHPVVHAPPPVDPQSHPPAV